ncbi:unnamed protein product, partial [Phaeothamnion confervicola]
MGTNPFSSPEAAVAWMESLCCNFHVDPKGAEVALRELRAAEGGIDASKVIFERSSIPMAQFHAISTIQAAALARWDGLSDGDRHGLRAFVWDVLVRRRDLDAAASAQALRTFCVFWKRSWADEPEENRRALLGHLAELVASGDSERSLLAAKTARALVVEFGSNNASSIGLPLEFHRRARHTFEECGLDECLSLGMELLSRVVTAVGAAGGSALDPGLVVAAAAVQLCTELLSWEFNERAPWQLPRSDELVCPGERWRGYLVRPDFLGAVFGLYLRVRGLYRCIGGGGRGGVNGASIAAAVLPHTVRQLLIQLGSVHGDIFEGTAQRSAYASFLVEGVTAVLDAPLEGGGSVGPGAMAGASSGGGSEASGDPALTEAYAAEVRDMTTLGARLLSNFQLEGLRPLLSFERFVRALAALTEAVLAGAAAEAATVVSVAGGGESWRLECLDVLLEAWVYIAEHRSVQTGLDPQLRAALSELTRPIYERYVAARTALARAEAECANNEENSEEEYIESADLREQMASAAMLGRLGAGAALALLTVQLEAALHSLAGMVATGTIGGRPALEGGG